MERHEFQRGPRPHPVVGQICWSSRTRRAAGPGCRRSTRQPRRHFPSHRLPQESDRRCRPGSTGDHDTLVHMVVSAVNGRGRRSLRRDRSSVEESAFAVRAHENGDDGEHEGREQQRGHDDPGHSASGRWSACLLGSRVGSEAVRPLGRTVVSAVRSACGRPPVVMAACGRHETVRIGWYRAPQLGPATSFARRSGPGAILADIPGAPVTTVGGRTGTDQE